MKKADSHSFLPGNSDQLTSQLDDRLTSQHDDKLTSQLEDKLISPLDDKLTNQLENKLSRQLECKLTELTRQLEEKTDRLAKLEALAERVASEKEDYR